MFIFVLKKKRTFGSVVVVGRRDRQTHTHTRGMYVIIVMLLCVSVFRFSSASQDVLDAYYKIFNIGG